MQSLLLSEILIVAIIYRACANIDIKTCLSAACYDQYLIKYNCKLLHYYSVAHNILNFILIINIFLFVYIELQHFSRGNVQDWIKVE